MKRLIILEGVDCSGKSTLSNKLWLQLKQKNKSLVIKDYHEPFLKLPCVSDNNAKVLLQTAQRVELYKEIEKSKEWVDYFIVDRSFLSTNIYQDIDMHDIWNLTTTYIDKKFFTEALWIILTPTETQLAQNMINRALKRDLEPNEQDLKQLLQLNELYKSSYDVLRNFIPKQNIKVYEEINDEVIKELVEELVKGEDNE